jgi:23S rRNA pseudouridine2604 synthase
MDFPMRINKYLAHKGYATRRSADVLIAEKRVTVNGVPALVGQQITERDVVAVTNGKSQKYQYFVYYKPLGVVTHSPEEGEMDIVGLVKKKNGITGVFPIGRLDRDAEGLILLTNDGRVTERILNPKEPFEQEYEVRVDKRVTQTFLNRLSKGVRIEGYMTRPATTTLSNANDRVFTIALSEGRKHHIKRMCATLGYAVEGLKRIRVGTLELKNLKSGMFHELKGSEVTKLERSLGLQ